MKILILSNFSFQKWFQNKRSKLKLTIPISKGQICKRCNCQSSHKSHHSLCQKYHYVVNDNTCHCGKTFATKDGVYLHITKMKCNDSIVNVDEDIEIGDSVEELHTEVKIEPEEDNLMIFAIEGNSEHYEITKPQDDENSVPNQVEDEPLLEFLKDLDFPELKIFIGDRSFDVHKFKLAKSPVFKQIILIGEEIKLSKDDYQAAIETLRFLYKEEIPEFRILDPVSAFLGGIKFQLKGLKDLSESSLEKIQLTETIVSNLYQHYEELNISLINKIEDFVFANLDSMVQCDRWCEVTTLRPDLNVKLLKAALSKKT